jgi:hypothetical protein
LTRRRPLRPARLGSRSSAAVAPIPGGSSKILGLDDAFGLVGIIAGVLGGGFIAVERYPPAEACFALSVLLFAACAITSNRHWLTRIAALLFAAAFGFLASSTDEYQIKKENEAFQQKLQMQLAQRTQTDVGEIKRLLQENNGKTTPTPDLRNFISSNQLEQKYPIGFALFYTDGRKTLHYGYTSESGISFDPTNVTVRFERNAIGHNVICIDGSPVKIRGKKLDVKNNCFGGPPPAKGQWEIDDVGLYVGLLASNTNEAAWLIGLKPAEAK